MTTPSGSLRKATSRTLKWNSIDRFSSQILYAVTGIVLANVLPKEDFGLVNAILIFQAFGILFVDSGFGAALLQKKEPTEEDYSTVFWFNLGVSVVVYIILYFCAPLIATIFHNRQELIPLSRMMFLCFILNALGIVQTNRLMKAMDVKQIAVANLAGLVVSGATGIWLALTGAGPWALVWQSITLAFCKSAWLWVTGGWRPHPVFSITSLRGIYRVGMGVFSSSFLNTLFLNIYSFVIGAYYSLVALAIYSQADKWSKMGHASLSQIITATFVPLLSRFQDNAERYKGVMLRVARVCSFITIPFMCGLAVMATPVFHTLFGHKWDEAIPLFQILMLRGILVIYISLCTNFLLALGHARSLVIVETVKDVSTLAAIVCTLPFMSVEALVWGQFVATAVTYIFILLRVRRSTGMSVRRLSAGVWHYLLPALPALAVIWILGMLPLHPLLILCVQAAAGISLYLLILTLMADPMLRNILRSIKGRFHR